VVDQVLVATGRTPNGAELDVGMTGVALDADGLVITDDRLATEVEGIWALGDIRSAFQLKHVANHETRVVQHNLLHPDSPIHVDERFVPHAVFGHPQIASVGQTEQELRGAGCDYLVGLRDHGDTAYGWAMEDSTGFVKVLVDPLTRELLGAHILGHQAAILLQQLVQGMRSGLTVDVMGRHQMYPHPTLAEVVENALLDV
jgi:mycothione reductase